MKYLIYKVFNCEIITKMFANFFIKKKQYPRIFIIFAIR